MQVTAGRHQTAVTTAKRRLDLWVNVQEVIAFDLPQSFASLRDTPLASPVPRFVPAMSAAILLTPTPEALRP